MSEQQQLAESVEQAVGQLDGLRTKLDGWQAELDRGFAELERQKASLSDQQAQGAEHDAKHRQQIDELRTQCDELHNALTSKEEEIESLRLAIESGGNGDGADLKDARQAAEEQNEQIHELERERVTLEAELEMVRTRAAELSDTLAQERRQMSEDRAEWANELKQLRRLMERQTAVSVATAAAQPRQAPAEKQPSEQPAAAASASRLDPVVGSVLAQFDKIRQQRAAQRNKRK